MKRPEALDTLRELEKQASPAPWEANTEDYGSDCWCAELDGPAWDNQTQRLTDYKLAAAVRNALPEILAYVEELEKAVRVSGAQPGYVLMPETAAKSLAGMCDTLGRLRTSDFRAPEAELMASSVYRRLRDEVLPTITATKQ